MPYPSSQTLAVTSPILTKFPLHYANNHEITNSFLSKSHPSGRWYPCPHGMNGRWAICVDTLEGFHEYPRRDNHLTKEPQKKVKKGHTVF
jgi:hypothetical protein